MAREFTQHDAAAECEIMLVSDVLRMNLCIPNYQRPYKWSSRSATELLDDILENARAGEDRRYRIGTLILHRENESFHVVDGQQRLLSLVLVNIALKPDFRCPLIENDDFKKSLALDKTSQKNLHFNFRVLTERIAALDATDRTFLANALETKLDFVVVCVKSLQEAFQLFDSQNTRGKRLYPHDLLKAYHLREMDDKYRMLHSAVRWETAVDSDIRDLFNDYLYPILHWSNQEKCGTFTEKEIDLFKGVSATSGFSYGRRTIKAMPCYQLAEPFESGEHFFGMVEHYLQMRKDVESEVASWRGFGDLLNKPGGTGLGYARRLFLCALMAFYDRFAFFDHPAVVKLCQWAFMVRVDMEHLGFDTINKYATNGENERYTNHRAMFRAIKKARKPNEIADLRIELRPSNEMNEERKWVLGALEALNRN